MNTTSRNRTLIFIIALLLITNLSLLAFLFFSKGHKHDREKDGKDGFIYLLKNEVGFSDAQLQQFNQLKEKDWAIAKADMDKIRKLKQDIFDFTRQPAISDAAIVPLADSVAILQKKVEINAFRHFKATRSICTPQQQPAYDSLMKRMIRQGRGSRSKPSDGSEK